ncbi:enoyl-CoA hydratase/isomerase family protein [Minwuia thermotolerans]|uniref:2-(1,2-epoxy-1,2-dihydrophenyl)acetyl-CoA isomerase n=1 Tax=Minwuia thermotolerans TaxID=2056226 RepID=A0A2M9G5C7_9PROT|nr:enoyl-CoA hydratase/isomerase family protein [Minwuia thermotolerans]PJK30927.1 2-(1,2-epoxy-1,2-dihydrophenyl)acetyl-CoA isomerase [Minwuia thermotolerans]
MRTGSFKGYETWITEPGVLWIRFNRPEQKNGTTSVMKRELIETLTEAQMDNAVRVVVFTGSGDSFSAGDNLKGYAKLDRETDDGQVRLIPGGHDTGIGTYSALRTISQQLNTVIREMDKITIAAINGVAIQTGFSLALCCDFRIAAEEARLGSGTLRFALLPDEGGPYLLVQHMGLAKTMDFLMRKKIVPAAEALELGLVHEVVPADRLMAAAGELAVEMAEGPQVAMRLLKRSVYNAAEMSWLQTLDDIAGKTAVTDHHPDAAEGKAAFMERRKARFNAWLDEAG